MKLQLILTSLYIYIYTYIIFVMVQYIYIYIYVYIYTKVYYIYINISILWRFPDMGYPQIIHFSWIFHYKPSILGYPHGHGNPHACIYIYITHKSRSWIQFIAQPEKFGHGRASFEAKLSSNQQRRYAGSTLRFASSSSDLSRFPLQ